MYCVRCGVSLETGSKSCPLCGTAVWNPEPVVKNSHYNPDLYPEKDKGVRIQILAALSVICLGVSLGCLWACLAAKGRPGWSAYVIASLALTYVIAILPWWFRRYHPMIFLPVSFGALELFTLFICLYTGGKWFLSFAFPVIGLLFISTFSGYILGILQIKPRVKLRLLGLYLVFLGGGTILIEFFLKLAFGLPLFTWSPYTAAVLGILGLFLFIASWIRPLRRAMYKKTFV